jgi:hypothetical protein
VILPGHSRRASPPYAQRLRDDKATTQDLIAKHGVQFPVGHSAGARAIAHATGAFVNPDPVYA